MKEFSIRAFVPSTVWAGSKLLECRYVNSDMKFLLNFTEETGLTSKRCRLQAVKAYLRRHRWFMLFVAAVLYCAPIASDHPRFLVESRGQRRLLKPTMTSRLLPAQSILGAGRCLYVIC